jgi:carboxyl-terminal processing protease
MRPNRHLLWFVVLTIAVCALLGGIYGSQVEATGDNNSGSDLQASLKEFTRVYSVVQQNYANKISADQCIFGPLNSMTRGAIPGMLRTLDPHSNFFSPKAFQELRLDQEGRYFGVGMVIRLRPSASNNNFLPTVDYPFPGSPAIRAGVRAGDVILDVNHKPTAGLSIDQVANMLKGPKGTDVNVTVSRLGSSSPLDFTITRAAIAQKSVDQAFMIRPGIGYIKLVSFDETTNDELTDTLRKFQHEGLQGLILDLRGNPGGLLRQAVEVAGHFLAKGQLIVYHYGRSSPPRRYYAPGGNQDGNDYPIVVLIDGNTASAAEIVTGALQDHDRALVLGEPSFGKGLVQTVYSLSDRAGLALTTAHYYTPSGRLIQRSYTDESLWDYFNHDDTSAPSHAQVYYTDGGRKVYGGGGITPDTTFREPTPDATLENLESHFAFYSFAKQYLTSHRDVPRNFVPDDQIVEAFKGYLERSKIQVSDKDFAQNEPDIRRDIREYILTTAYGGQQEDRLLAEDDPLIEKALTELPQASQLMANAKRYMASRSVN